MRRAARSTSTSLLLIVGVLLLAACGGSDAADADPIDNAAQDELPVAAPADDAATSGIAPDEPVDPDDPAVSGEAPEGASSGGAYSGGVLAENFDGICEVLDEAKVAELFGIEANSVVSSVNTSTGVCEFGDGGTVRLLVSRPDLSVGADAPDFYRDTIDFIIAEGISVAEADVNDVLRATFIERGDATIAFALDPYYVELRDTGGQDIPLTVLVTDVVAALR